MIFIFALQLTLGGKLDICGRDDLFLLFTISGPAGLALNNAPPFQISGHALAGGGGPRCHGPLHWPCNKVLKPNF